MRAFSFFRPFHLISIALFIAVGSAQAAKVRIISAPEFTATELDKHYTHLIELNDYLDVLFNKEPQEVLKRDLYDHQALMLEVTRSKSKEETFQSIAEFIGKKYVKDAGSENVELLFEPAPDFTYNPVSFRDTVFALGHAKLDLRGDEPVLPGTLLEKIVDDVKTDLSWELDHHGENYTRTATGFRVNCLGSKNQVSGFVFNFYNSNTKKSYNLVQFYVTFDK